MEFPFRRGFTLIELMVVMSIIFILSMIVLTSQNSFNKTLILANTAYDVALTLRSVETQGLGSRITSGGAENVGYGINLQSGSPSSFTLFADSYPAPSTSNCHGIPGGDAGRPDVQPGDCAYNGLASGEFLQTYTLGNGITIRDFCAGTDGTPASWTCKVANGMASLDIIFARPNPLPFISRSGVYSKSYTGACITLSSPQGTTRFVYLSSSGEISVNPSSVSCPPL